MTQAADATRGRLISLRSKVTIVALSILVAAAATVWVLSAISYRSGMSRTAARLHAYKADHLREFVESQLELLGYLELESDETYVRLARDSMRAFAFGMVGGPSELVAAVEPDGTLAFSTRPIGDAAAVGLADRVWSVPRGWLAIDLDGATYLGEAFRMDGAGLGFYVASDRTEFFREQRTLTMQNLAALLILGSAAGVTMALVIKGMLTPLSEVAGAMREIAVTKDFSRRVQVRHPDEIGVLSVEFNRMIGELGTAYERLKEVAEREQRLRGEVTVRERETLEVMGRATEYKDPETSRHIVRVGIYASLVARELGESEETQDLLRNAAPLHDIGKLGIPDSILLKPGPLTGEEYERMEEHTLIAHGILSNTRSKYLQAGAVIALSHHEHWDGSGYPHGLAGDEIPLFGRIVGMVDVFDALISRRPYKEPWQLEAAIAEVKALSGIRFDPKIVQAFERCVGEIAEVVSSYQDEYA